MANKQSTLISYGASVRKMNEEISVLIRTLDGKTFPMTFVPADVANEIDLIKFKMDSDDLMGVVSRRISGGIIYTFGITTAASDGVRIAINPVFAQLAILNGMDAVTQANITGDAAIAARSRFIQFIILHECFHQIYDHHSQYEIHVPPKDRNNLHGIANIAMDAEINRDIESSFNGRFKGITKDVGGVMDTRFPTQDWIWIFDQYTKYGVSLPAGFQSPEIVEKKLYAVDNPQKKKQKIIDTQEHELVDADEDPFFVQGYNDTIEKIARGLIKPSDIKESFNNKLSFNMFLYESVVPQTPDEQKMYHLGELAAARAYEDWLDRQAHPEKYANNDDELPPPPAPKQIAQSQLWTPPGQDSKYDVEYTNLKDKTTKPKVNTTYSKNPNQDQNRQSITDPNNSQDGDGDGYDDNDNQDNTQNGKQGRGKPNKNNDWQEGYPGNPDDSDDSDNQDNTQNGKQGRGKSNKNNDWQEGYPGNEEDPNNPNNNQNGKQGPGKQNKNNDWKEGYPGNEEDPNKKGPDGPPGKKPMPQGNKNDTTQNPGKENQKVSGDYDYEYNYQDVFGGADIVSQKQMAEWAEEGGEPYTADEKTANPAKINAEYNAKNQSEFGKIKLAGGQTLGDKVSKIMELLGGRVAIGNWKEKMKKHLKIASDSGTILKRGRVRLGQEDIRLDYALPYKERKKPKEDSANVFYLVDNSGSMYSNGTDVFIQIFKEILTLETLCKINTSAYTYFSVSPTIDPKYIRMWNEKQRKANPAKIIDMIRQRDGDDGGGTDIPASINAVLNLPKPYYYNYHDKKHRTLIVVFTDGEDNSLEKLKSLTPKEKEGVIFCLINNMSRLQYTFTELIKCKFSYENILCINCAEFKK